MVTNLAVIAAVLCGSGARENQKGLQAWTEKDTVAAIRHLEKAAQDTSDPRYGYNLGTLQSLSGRPGAQDAFDRALRFARDSMQRARILYNRGTARLDSARSNHGDPSAAAQDFRDALKLHPGWQQAARNLELALRKPPPQKNQNKDQDKKEDKKNQDKKGGNNQQQNPKDSTNQEQQPQAQPGGMDRQDAQRLLDAAKADEGKQLKRPVRKEETDGPDW
jgi:tetratricopeptide (TPR) repeat protein